MEDERIYGFTGSRARWIRWELAAVLGYVLFAYGIPSLVSYQSFGSEIPLPDWTRSISNLGPIAIFAWLIWMSGDSLEMFGLGRPKLKDLYWFLGLGAVAFAERTYGVVQFRMALRELTPNMEVSLLPPFSIAAFATALLMFVLPAVFEELLNRGLLQARIMEICRSAWVAIGAQAVLFAMLHIYQGTDLLWHHLLFGLVLGVARWRGCNLWALVAVHTLSNATTSGYIWLPGVG